MHQDQTDRIRILAVDDDEHILDLYREFLSTETSIYDFDLTTCNRTEAAVETVRLALEKNHPFAAAFLDVRMPSGPDGVWAAEQIRAIDPEVEIVIVTAHTDVRPEVIVPRVPPAGKLLYIRKPFSQEEIQQFAVALGAKWHQDRQLMKIHAELETRVQERTADLSKANEQLRREIKERLRAEEELQQGEERYRSILENIEEGYFEVDLAGNFTYFNESLCKIAGYEPNEMMSMNNREYTTTETAKEMYQVFNEIYRTGKPATIVDYEIFRKDGTPRILEMSASLMRDSAGQPIGFRGVSRDVTNRKKAEEALRESEERYRSLFKNSLSVMLLIDQETADIVDANPAACSFYGWSHEELTGKKITDINTLTKDQVFQEMEQARSEQRSHFFFRHRLANDEVLDVEVYSGPIKLHGKQLLYSIVYDITERKLAEEALRQSEERYRTVLEANPDPVVVYDMEGRVIYLNPAFTQVFGWPLEECIGKKMDVFVPEESWPETQMMIDRVLTDASSSGIETHRYTKEGSIIPVSVSGAIYRDRDGSPAGIVINLRDVSQQKKLEAQLQQAQKMEAVGTLAGGIAHDFNNLLQAVQGYSELLLMRRGEKEPGRRELQEIVRASKRGGELTQQLLTFSRRVESKRRPLDLNLEVEGLIQLLKRTLPKMIEVELGVSGDLHLINADSVQVGQILMNLAVNAMDAMPEGGKLLFNTANVTLDQEFCRRYVEICPGDYVLLSISDTGHGMDKETLSHIFDPFYTTKEVGKGSGLGLAMVYGIVKNHEGYIMCYSQPGEGTAFKIYLPVIETRAEAFDNIEEPDLFEHPSSENVLVVDDEEFIRDLGVELLSEAGYTVLAAADGESALELYLQEKERIDLIILDLIMPGMGGRRCLEELLKINPEAKVLIASGHSPDGPTKEILEGGAKGFVSKPYDMTQILKAVREILDRS